MAEETSVLDQSNLDNSYASLKRGRARGKVPSNLGNNSKQSTVSTRNSSQRPSRHLSVRGCRHCSPDLFQNRRAR